MPLSRDIELGETGGVLAFGCVYSLNGTDRDPSPSRPASGVCECMLWHSPREQGGQPGKDPHALEPRDAARPLDRIAARSSYHGPARADSSIVVRHLSSYGLAPAIALCEKSSVVVRHEPEMLFASSARTDRILWGEAQANASGAAHGEAPSEWARLTSIGTRRGGAAVGRTG